MIGMVAAVDDKLGLAKDGRIPWDLPSDRQFFRDTIRTAPGLMGWNTFASNRHRPFPTCPRNFVLTNRDEKYDGVKMVNDLEGFLDEYGQKLWIIGGGSVFEQVLPRATHLYLTRVEGDFNCDVFFPEFEEKFELTSESPQQTENGINFRYQIWQPKRAG